MRKSNVLVTAIGSFSSDAVISSLKRDNHRIIGTNIYPKEWIAESKDVDVFYRVPKAREEKNFIESILEICSKESIEYIIPLTDVEIDVFNKCREQFNAIHVILCISSYETISICRDKRKTNKILCSHNDITTIPEYTLQELKSGNIKFPLICKKINGRSSEGMKRFYDKDELDIFLKDNSIDSYLVQPFIEGNIITVDVVRDKKRNKCITISRKELLRTLNGAGTSVEVFEDIDLENISTKIADILDVNGCVNFEFIKSSDGNYFLECNPRFSGGVKFSCMSGYDCVLNHLRCFSGDKIDDKGKIIHQYIARKYEEYITFIN